LGSLSGDFYIDTGAWCIYGPLSSDGWGPGQPLIANGTCEKIVFITSGTYTGDLGGLAGADQKCAAEATAAGLDGEFKAWLSDSPQNSPSTRFSRSSAPYILPVGTVVANDWEDLVDGSIQNPIEQDAFGNTVRRFVWTGTNTDGSYASGFFFTADPNCEGWSSSVDTAPNDFTSGAGLIGRTTFDDPDDWTADTVSSCRSSNSLYCFQQ
jgi:hypothetical protein